MNLNADKSSESFLLRLRKKDTPVGVSSETVSALMEKTGLSKTEIAHLALRMLADRYLPSYEMDGGPLTSSQINKIRELNSNLVINRDFLSKRLFE